MKLPKMWQLAPATALALSVVPAVRASDSDINIPDLTSVSFMHGAEFPLQYTQTLMTASRHPTELKKSAYRVVLLVVAVVVAIFLARPLRLTDHVEWT